MSPVRRDERRGKASVGFAIPVFPLLQASSRGSIVQRPSKCGIVMEGRSFSRA